MNIKSIIEQEIKRILKEANEEDPEAPPAAGFTDEKAAEAARPAEKAQEPAAAKPAGKKIAYANQSALAKSKYATSKQFGLRCIPAERIQKKIMSKIDITEENLIRRLTDKKMGYITASVTNFAIGYAKGQKIGVGTVQEIALNKEGYRKACKMSEADISIIEKIIDSIPDEVVQKKVEQAAAKKPITDARTALAQELIKLGLRSEDMKRSLDANNSEDFKYALKIALAIMPYNLDVRTNEEFSAEVTKAAQLYMKKSPQMFGKEEPVVARPTAQVAAGLGSKEQPVDLFNRAKTLAMQNPQKTEIYFKGSANRPAYSPKRAEPGLGDLLILKKNEKGLYYIADPSFGGREMVTNPTILKSFGIDPKNGGFFSLPKPASVAVPTPVSAGRLPAMQESKLIRKMVIQEVYKALVSK